MPVQSITCIQLPVCRFEYSSDVPTHNHDPPCFATRGLGVVLEDWGVSMQPSYWGLMCSFMKREEEEEESGHS